MDKLNIHLVSDYSGKTVRTVYESVKLRFFNIEIKEYFWPLIKNRDDLIKSFNVIRANPGIILYTLTNSEIRSLLKTLSNEEGIKCVSVVGRIVKEISLHVGEEKVKGDSKEQKFDEEYFDKIDAIEYTLKHDDGQNIDSIDEADIIILGASRTSKTPTSVYLANIGYKTANIPFVQHVGFPEKVKLLRDSCLVVGLTIDYDRLIQIREKRIHYMGMNNDQSSYIRQEDVIQECKDVKSIFIKNKIPIIDVTTNSIEETSAIIIQKYLSKKNAK